MIRRTSVFLAAAVFVVGVSAQAGAGILTLSGGSLGLAIGGVPPVFTPLSGPVLITVSSGSGSFTEPAGIFDPATVPIPRSFFTGVSTLSGFTLIGLNNGTKVVNGAAGTAVGGLAANSIVRSSADSGRVDGWKSAPQQGKGSSAGWPVVAM